MRGAKWLPSLKSVTHPAMMKQVVIHYLKKIQKYANHLTPPPVILLTSACFQWKSVNFAISRYADKDWILVHNF